MSTNVAQPANEPPNVIYIDLIDKEIQDLLGQIEREIEKQLEGKKQFTDDTKVEPEKEESFWDQESSFEECDV